LGACIYIDMKTNATPPHVLPKAARNLTPPLLLAS
jgi:hypothetical protein